VIKHFCNPGFFLHAADSGRGGGLFAVDYEEFLEDQECQFQQAEQWAQEHVKLLHNAMSVPWCTKFEHKSRMCATKHNHHSVNGFVAEIIGGFWYMRTRCVCHCSQAIFVGVWSPNNALKFLTLSGLRVFLVIVGLMADLGRSTCTIGITALVS
jgi:hypothetical protein